MPDVQDELGTVPESPTCPDCDGPMTLRTNKRGSQFWGCDRYPNCQGLVDAGGSSMGPPSLPKPIVDDFRRETAVRILLTLLEHPENRKFLWERYIVDRGEAQLAVHLADDLVKELEKVR